MVVPVYRRQKVANDVNKAKEDILGNVDKRFKEEREAREKELKELKETTEKIEKDRATAKVAGVLGDSVKKSKLEEKKRMVDELGKGIYCPTCVGSVGSEGVSGKEKIKNLKKKLEEEVEKEIIDSDTDKELHDNKHHHLHKLERSENDKGGLTLKCTGPDCKKEYILVDPDSDYQCNDCKIPINSKTNPDTCPLCGSKDAKRFNWKMYRDIRKERQGKK